MISDTLLDKWLAHYDPIHRGFTPAGIANGVCATVGFGFPRIRGGYNLRRGLGAGPEATAAIVGSAGADATTIQTFPWARHDADTTYVYRLSPISGGGVENWKEETLAVTAFGADGAWLGARPNRPSDLQVTPTSAGRFVVGWTYNADGEQAEPAAFNVYHNGGSGGVDYASVAGTVAHHRGRLHFAYTSEAFAHGTGVTWAVRAVSAAGAEELNEEVAVAWAEAEAPPVNPTVVVSCL